MKVNFETAICMTCIKDCKNQNCKSIRAIKIALNICDKEIFLAENFSIEELSDALEKKTIVEKAAVEDMSQLTKEIIRNC